MSRKSKQKRNRSLWSVLGEGDENSPSSTRRSAQLKLGGDPSENKNSGSGTTRAAAVPNSGQGEAVDRAVDEATVSRERTHAEHGGDAKRPAPAKSDGNAALGTDEAGAHTDAVESGRGGNGGGNGGGDLDRENERSSADADADAEGGQEPGSGTHTGTHTGSGSGTGNGSAAALEAEEEPGQGSVSFETAMESLEEEVRTLEQGGLSLEEAIAAFERGVSMFETASKQLHDAELRVQQVLESAGEIRVERFDAPELDDNRDRTHAQRRSNRSRYRSKGRRQ